MLLLLLLLFLLMQYLSSQKRPLPNSAVLD